MILTLIEHEGGQPAEVSLQALTLARRLAQGWASPQSGAGDARSTSPAQAQLAPAPLHAVAIGAAPSLADSLAAYGVEVLHLAQHDRLDQYAPEAWAQAIVELLTLQPKAIIAPGTERGNEVLAHVGARTGLPMAANCTDAQPGDPLRVTRVRWGGSLLEDAQLGGAVKLLTVAPHSLAAEATSPASSLTVRPFAPALADKDFRVRVARRVTSDTGKVSLADAKVVVGGGRGVANAESFRHLEALATLLGGVVGCSRAITSLGWRPHADQIGQTGTRIAPELYIACGISGAIQHMVGCKGAKHLLAINTDRDAPIMLQADYAIIGDLHDVLPALCEALKKPPPA